MWAGIDNSFRVSIVKLKSHRDHNKLHGIFIRENHNNNTMLEVCVDSFESAKAAVEGGIFWNHF